MYPVINSVVRFASLPHKSRLTSRQVSENPLIAVNLTVHNQAEGHFGWCLGWRSLGTSSNYDWQESNSM
jgi:hypothetical protein